MFGRKNTSENVWYVIRLRSRSCQPKASPAREACASSFGPFVLMDMLSTGVVHT